MTKKIAVIIFLTVICVTCIDFGAAFAAGKRVRAQARGIRGGRRIGVIRPRRIIVAPRFEPIIVEPVIVRPYRSAYVEPVVVREVVPHEGPEFGFSGGLFANMPSMAGEVWFHKLMGIDSAGLKAGLRYAAGDDSDGRMRRNTLISIDGTMNLTGGPASSVYLAGGLNYLAYTTGQTSGAVGAELYLGVQEGSIAFGSLYAEAGYSEVRTGFSSPMKGLILNLGFKAVY